MRLLGEIISCKKISRTKKPRNVNKAFIQMILYALESIKKQLPLINNIKSKTKQVFAHIYISNLSQTLLKSTKNKQATFFLDAFNRKMLSFLFCLCIFFLDVFEYIGVLFFFVYVIGHIKMLSLLFAYVLFFLRCVLWLCNFFMKKIRNLLITSFTILLTQCSTKRNNFIIKYFLQFTFANLDDSQKEEGSFLNLLQNRGGFPQKRGGSNQGGNHGL